MIRYFVCAIPVTYFLATLVFHSFWNNLYDTIGIRYDLTPEQMRVLPLTANILALVLAVLSLVLFLRKCRSSKSSGSKIAPGLILSVITATALLFGSARWIVIDSQSMAMGFSDFFSKHRNRVKDLRTIQNGYFVDRLLGITFSLPPDWNILTANAIRRAHDSGSRTLLGRNPKASELQIEPGADQFLAIKKYPENYRGYNPSINFVSYEKAVLHQHQQGTLKDIVRAWSKVSPPYKLVSRPSTVQVDDFSGYRIQIESDFRSVIVQQHIYLFETSEYYLSITISTHNLKDQEILESVINSIKKAEQAAPSNR